MSTSITEDAQPFPASQEDQHLLKSSGPSEKQQEVTSKDDEERKEEEEEEEVKGGFTSEERSSFDLETNGKKEIIRLQEELEEEEEEEESASETEDEATVVDVAPIEPLDPFKAFDDEEDLLRLAGVVDSWSSGLKKHLSAEFQSVKERLCLISRGAVANHHSELTIRQRSLHDQVAQLRAELAASRAEAQQRDRLVLRLGEEVARQKERVLLAARFADWRVLQEREKREKFCLAIATRHHARSLKRRVFRGLQSSFADSLTALLERRCRGRAEEVCARLASEHEDRVGELNKQLEASQAELSAAVAAQAAIREEVRAALVRGVSALNSDPKKQMAPMLTTPEERREENKEYEVEEVGKDDEDDRATYTLSDDDNREREKVIIASAPQRRVTTGVLLRAQQSQQPHREARARPLAGPAVGRGAVFHHEGAPHRPIAGQEAFEAPPPPRPRVRSPVASVLVQRQHGVNKRTASHAAHGASTRRLKT